MAKTLKGDILNSAFSKLRISGLTVLPSAEDNELALGELEAMAEEFKDCNMCGGYRFESDPDTGSKHGLEPKYFNSYASMLAVRLMPDFGKGMAPDPILLQQAQVACSNLAGSTAKTRPLQPQAPFPIGSGNQRCFMYSDPYYEKESQAPLSCSTNSMFIGDINDYTESFETYLVDGETVASYTIAATSGLTIVSDSLTDPEVSYRISAIGPTAEAQTVTIVATTDLARVETRVINFSLSEA